MELEEHLVQPLLLPPPTPDSPDWRRYWTSLRWPLDVELMAPFMTVAQRRQFLTERLSYNLEEPRTLVMVQEYLNYPEPNREKNNE